MLLNIPNLPKHKLDTDNWEVYSTYSKTYLKKLVNKKGYYHYDIKVNGRKHKVFLHRLIYETIKGAIPEGYVIHHIDENKHNNNPENLAAMPFSEHSSMHNKGRTYGPSPLKGIKRTKEFCEKISKALKGKPRYISPEQRKKMAEGHKGKKNNKPSVHLPQRKPVLMFDKEMNFIKEYSYGGETAKDGFYPQLVCQCCQRARKTHKGFIFRYKSELPDYCNLACVVE